jgi:hypothetical protein
MFVLQEIGRALQLSFFMFWDVLGGMPAGV